MSELRRFNHYRPDNATARRAECERISGLMASSRPFSFLRLGDMELMYLVACQSNTPLSWQQTADSERKLVSSVVAFGHPGLKPEHATRLQTAYERCSYLDFHDGWIVNKREYPRWKHNRPLNYHRNPSAELSQLFFDWLRYEFFAYVKGRRCLFVGAEAGILKELHSDAHYREIAKSYWPSDADPVFLPETRRVGDCLDDIKNDISKCVIDNAVDTVFISLGGGSKILCYELAEKLKIATFDFGGLMRGLTYSGSDGHNFFRSTHYPFYFRVPFDTYMNALRRAAPNLAPEKVLAKAHAQLMIELIRKEEGWSYASERGGDDCIDLSEENTSHFWRSYSIYRDRYSQLGKANAEAMRQIHEFDAWRRQLGLGIDGKFYRLSSMSKAAIRSVIRRYFRT